MKIKYLIIVSILTFFFSSAIPTGSHTLEIGKEAPAITITGKRNQDFISQLNGNYILLNFWSASDPESRINNRLLANLTSRTGNSGIKFVSVCTDADRHIAEEILKVDGINELTTTLFLTDITPEVLEDFQVNSGLRSFLIDPYGNLAAISPSHQTLNSIN